MFNSSRVLGAHLSRGTRRRSALAAGSAQCTITFTSNTTGTVTGHATVSMNLTTSEGLIAIVRQTDGAGGNDDAVKESVDGSLAWLTNDDVGARLGGATFEVCRTHTLNTSTNPDVVTAELTLQPGPKGVTITEAFVNRALYPLIVITCNTTTDELVDSTVTLNGDTRETVKPGQLGGIDQNALCTLPGANHDNLTRGTYNPSVELPHRPPLFP